jgi:hypothetical protein
MREGVRSLLVMAAASLALPSLFLLYLIPENPFEFATPGCGGAEIEGWRDVVRSGCLDASYVAQFIGLYAGMLFLLFAAIAGLMLLARRRG